MAIQVSPGVVITETDATGSVTSASSTTGGFAGTFQWGPVLEVRNIASEAALVATFGKPNAATYLSFFTAANFLAYGSSMNVVRNVGATAKNAVAGATPILIKNSTDYSVNFVNGVAGSGAFAAKYAGSPGNGLRISIADAKIFNGQYVSGLAITNAGAGYSTAPTVTITGNGTGATATAVLGTGATAGTVVALNITASGTGYTSATVSFSGGGTPTTVATATATIGVKWPYASLFSVAPGTSSDAASVGGSNDEMCAVVIDTLGTFSGTPGTVLETYAYISKASDAKNASGTSNYYKNVLNGSTYLWWIAHLFTGLNLGNAKAGTAFADLTSLYDVTLAGGVSDDTLADAVVQAGYAMFVSKDSVSVSLVPLGGASTTVATYVISNIAEARRDCVAFVSPKITDVVNNPGLEATSIIATRNLLTSSSYTVMDSGWKYQYDSYNDVYRWIPLNGDIAGLCAQTDYTNDPWWSPAGVTRGQIKNSVKLAYSPNQADRDVLYPLGINPVVTMSGQGTFLYGDKTLQSKSGAFDRINIRRLFIVMEQALFTYTQGILFEFNDSFTRAQFKSTVEPYLRDVQGRRGITDFLVVCDASNNTQQIIDGKSFKANIYVKANNAINYANIVFTAAASGVTLSTLAA
jgi:hypothetical protein